MEQLNVEIHCHKCKKKTTNINPEIVQMINGLYRITTKCSICKTNKSKIIKNPYLTPIIKKEINKKYQIIEAKNLRDSRFLR